MAINFPNTPAINDTFTSSGSTWKYDGTKWDIVTTTSLATVGDKGGVKYTFSNVTTDADPGNGLFRFNNATIALASFLYIDNIDAGGNTQTTWYDTWDDASSTLERGFLIIQDNLGTNVAIFRVTSAVTVATGYYKIPVSYVSGSALINSSSYIINFTRSGNTGPSGTLAVGTVTTGAAGSSATVTNVGTSTAATLNFTIPRGDTGQAATVAVGTTTTVLPGQSASVTNSGTSGAAVLNFSIPYGDAGGVPYNYSNNTTIADPGVGYFRFNSTTPASITTLAIHLTDLYSNLQTGWFNSWDDSSSTIRGKITFMSNSGFAVITFNVIGAVTISGNYAQVPVSWVAGSLPINLETVMLLFAATGDQGESMITFSQSGVVTSLSGQSRYRFPFAATILGVTSAISGAPTGASLIVDVNKNGSAPANTIFTTQANRPTIAINANASHTGTNEAVPDVTSIAAGDYLTVDIDQVGSTFAGSDLTVFIRYKRA